MPRTLKGFRDFLPGDKRARDVVQRRVVETFEHHGFEPLETPTLEFAALILGKYGAEADRLVYTFEDRGGRQVALPYDQTVPTARVLAQYRNDLPRYFRRYAISNVFRAEKPQRGRYREFTQCDIDIYGSTSPLSDAEIVACTFHAFRNVGFPQVTLKLNDRVTLLETLQPFATGKVDVFSIIQTLDKLDKMSRDKVLDELAAKGLEPDAAGEALERIEGAAASDNLRAVLAATKDLDGPTLARGLDYYTGMIFEVTLPDFSLGSFAGGGRYDELIAQLGGPEMPAVGVAFGFDRMVEAAVQLGLVPDRDVGARVMVAVFDEGSLSTCLQLAAELRAAGIATEVHPGVDKIGKQFKLADQKGISLVAVVGPDEAAEGTVTLRDMKTREQTTVARADVVSTATRLLG
jgi:histidyl-tRNA synthetase